MVELIYTKYLKADITYENVTRIETYPFPRDAIREAVYNAIVHKAYETLIPIQIKVFEDRIYIANDCVFPEDWTVEHLLGEHKSRPYNPSIANTFFRAGLIEAWGRGIEKIKESCETAGNPQPEYTVHRGDIMVAFRGLGSSTTQAATQAPQGEGDSICAKILTVIQKDPHISQKRIADILGVKHDTIKYHVRKLKESGTLAREGTSQKGKWVILK